MTKHNRSARGSYSDCCGPSFIHKGKFADQLAKDIERASSLILCRLRGNFEVIEIGIARFKANRHSFVIAGRNQK